ncbi:CvpA family protein, partial [Neisseria sp. P0001.S004]
SLAVAMGFAAVFFLAWLLQKLARSLLSSLMSAVGLGSINRLLGGVFGAVKGVILVTLAVMVFSHTDLPKTEEWQSSYTIPYFESLSDAAMPYLPGKDTAMPHLSGKAAEVEELDD